MYLKLEKVLVVIVFFWTIFKTGASFGSPKPACIVGHQIVFYSVCE